MTNLFAENILHVTLFTILQAAVSTITAVIIGIPAAFLTSRRNFPGRKFLLSLSSVPLCIPALIIALGYVSFFGMNGALNRLLINLFRLSTPPLTFLYSVWGIIIAQGFYNFPLVMQTVSDSWEQQPHDEADCARLLGASEGRIFRTITIFELAPSIISACIPVFLYCFFSFMIVILFGSVGCTTLEVEIYRAARSTLNFGEAGTLVVIETLTACACVTLWCALEQRSQKSTGISFTGSEDERREIRGWRETVFALVFFVFTALFFLAPLSGIAVNAFTSPVLKNGATASKVTTIFSIFSSFRILFSMKGFGAALASTLYTAAATGFFSTALAFAYASFLRSSDERESRLFFRVIPMIPMAISSVATGFVLTLLVHRGTPALLVAAQTALTWPVAFRQLYAPLSKIDRDTIDAARLLSKNTCDIIFKIYLPVCAKSLLSAFGFCFAVSVGDTTLPLVLAIPKFSTLALLTYRLAGAYRFHEACAAGLLLGVLCALIFAGANALKEKNK
jgi:thiamine transport system permease protein